MLEDTGQSKLGNNPEMEREKLFCARQNSLEEGWAARIINNHVQEA